MPKERRKKSASPHPLSPLPGSDRSGDFYLQVAKAVRAGQHCAPAPCRMDSLFQTLLVEDQQHVWRKLDTDHPPFSNAAVTAHRTPIRQTVPCMDSEVEPVARTICTAARDMQPARRQSSTVGDWLAFGTTNGPDLETMQRNSLDSSLDLLVNAFQIPRELSPFHCLRSLAPPLRQEVKLDPKESVARQWSEANKHSPEFRSASLLDCDRADQELTTKDTTLNGSRTSTQILGDWELGKMSLRDSIQKAKTMSRPPAFSEAVTRRGSVQLPQPSKSVARGLAHEPEEWLDFLQSVYANGNDGKTPDATELNTNLNDIYLSSEQAAEESTDTGMDTWRQYLSVLRART